MGLHILVGPRRQARFLDIALGFTVAGWAFSAWYAAAPLDRHAPALWALVLLHVVVATLLFTRRPARSEGSWRLILACVPSLLVAGIAWQFAPVPSSWPFAASLGFVIGVGVTVIAFLSLGRSFAVLPSVRAIVSRGPYRFIRHPAYAGELLMAAACLVAADSVSLAIWFVPALLGTVALRILVEERHLRTDEAYRSYAEKVRFRLFPGVW